MPSRWLVFIMTIGVAAVTWAWIDAQESFRMEGLVTFGGHPPGEISFSIKSDTGEDDGWFRSVTTTKEGNFHVDVPRAGRYVLAIGSNATLPTTAVSVHVTRPSNRVIIPLQNGTVDLMVALPANDVTDGSVRFRFDGPMVPNERKVMLGFLTTVSHNGVRLKGLTPGAYRISANTRDGKAGFVEVDVPADGRIATARLELVRRVGHLRVFPQDPSAVTRAFVDGRRVKVSDGRIALSGFAPGQRLVIVREGFLPACRTLSIADWGNSTLELEPASGRRILRLVNTRLPLGQLAVSGQCEIHMDALNTRSAGDEVTATIDVSPHRDYRYVLDNPYVSVALDWSAVEAQDVVIPNSAERCMRHEIHGLPSDGG